MVAQPATPAGAGAARLSVVLPAFNLEAMVARTVTALREELRPLVSALEFVLVDDGSRDGTANAALALARSSSDVRVLRNTRNLGKGMSVYLGILAARHELVCFTDGDLPFTPGNYARFVGPLLRGAPFVIASRRLPDSQILVRMDVLGYAARRHFVGVVFNHCVRWGLGVPFRDTQCGLKGFTREVAIDLFRRVRSTRFLFDIELIVAARAAGVPVEEVPVCVEYADFKSSIKLAGDSTRMLSGLAAICARDWRGGYATSNSAMDPAVVRPLAEELT